MRDYGTASWEGGDAECDHLVGPLASDKNTLGGGKGQVGEDYKVQAFGQPFKGDCGKCGATRIDSQLGLEPTPEQYVQNLVEVFREVRRVLRDDGVVFLNLGDSYAGALREGAYDRLDTELADCPARDCLCGSLCGACRVAYQTGKAHSDGRLAPRLVPSPSASNRERKESESDRPPTSDSSHPAGRSGAAKPRLERTADRVPEQPHASRASMLAESSPQRRGDFRPLDSPSACQLCGRSLDGDVPASDRMTACTCGTSQRSPSSADRMTGRAPSGSASPHLTIPSRLKPKDLVGVPWRVAFALQEDGWWLRSDIIWAKPNPMPESVTDRPTRSHEYIFLLSKSARYFYDADAVREPNEHPDRTGTNPRLAVDNTGLGAHGSAMNGGIESNPAGRNKRSVWTVATQPYSEAHFATFPPKLIEPCILAGSAPKACGECGAPWERVVEVERPDDYDPSIEAADPKFRQAMAHRGNTANSRPITKIFADSQGSSRTTTGWQPTCSHSDDSGQSIVLDPFAGSGTTGLVALRHNRSFIGLELNPEYVEMARNRIRDDAPLLNTHLEAA